MKHLLLTAILFSVFLHAGFSQSSKGEKQMEKAKEQVQKNKLDDAEKTLLDFLKEEPSHGEAWDLLAKIRYQLYTNAKSTNLGLGGNITITTTDAKGNEVSAEDDSLASSLMKLLNSMSPAKVAWSKYLYTLRKATLLSESATYSSVYLRHYTVDVEVDTNISPKALKYFNQAETEFQNKNYNKAAQLYQRALDEQPDFYKAQLYLGDSYYFQENYVDAIASFNAAIARFPDFLEPRKFLIDAYHKEGLHAKSVEAAIGAMMVYPDLSVKMKLEDAAFYNGQKLDMKWTPRLAFPLTVVDTTKGLNTYSDPDSVKLTEPWTHYANALTKARDYCNDNGVFTKVAPFTKAAYLEVFAWEEMLSNSTHESLAEARRMQKEGYLDCYVMLTCFHNDFHAQYTHFVKNNQERIGDFYEKFLVAR